jgi:hypothetical protein
MDSLDAQCLIIETVEREMPLPGIWRHDCVSGSLSCAYEGGENVFTWPREDVAAMARRWRDSDAHRTSKRARQFVDAYQRLEAVIRESGLRPPDTVTFHLGLAALRAQWDREKVVVEVDGIGKARSPDDVLPAGEKGGRL